RDAHRLVGRAALGLELADRPVAVARVPAGIRRGVHVLLVVVLLTRVAAIGPLVRRRNVFHEPPGVAHRVDVAGTATEFDPGERRGSRLGDVRYWRQHRPGVRAGDDVGVVLSQ